MRADLLVVALVAGAISARASTGENYLGSDLARLSLSAREAGAGSLYGSYDIYKVFSNPALLANQPRTWEFGAGDALQFGGEQNVWSLAGGWGGKGTDVGTFGAGLLLSGLNLAEIKGTDLNGMYTGENISPAIYHLGLAGLYQWQFVSFGGGFHLLLPAGYPSGDKSPAEGYAWDLGTTVSLGKLDLGFVYHIYDDTYTPGEISFGFAFKGTNWFRSAGLDLNIPFAPSTDTSSSSGSTAPTTTTAAALKGSPTTIGGGLTFAPHPLFLLRLGLVTPASSEYGQTLRAGFSVPWRDWTLDYALGLAISGDAGAQHTLGVGWTFGADRKPAEGPKFFMKQEERTLAVATFDAQNVSAGDAAVISDMIRNQLIKEGAFNIIEKANMDKILGEQAFQQTGCTTQECAVKLGKVLNVKFLVVGSFGKALEQYVVSMRVIDVETAKAVYSDETYGKNLPEVREGITKIAASLTEAVKKAK